MIGPPRLFDISGDDLERRLLDSVRYDRAPAEAEARCVAAVAAAVIVASQVALVSAAGAATTASATAPSAAASTAAAVTTATTTTGLAVAVKAVAIGLTVGLAAQGTFEVAKHWTSPSTVTRAHLQTVLASAQPLPPSIAPRQLMPSAASAVVEAPVSTRLSSAPLVASPARAVERNSPEPAAVSTTTSLVPAVARRAGSDDPLEREVAILDGARRACGVGNYSSALAQLERHAAEFPAGALAPEALVVRVRALLGLGRRSEAEALAKRHISAQPNSAVARRLNVLMGWQSQ